MRTTDRMKQNLMMEALLITYWLHCDSDREGSLNSKNRVDMKYEYLEKLGRPLYRAQPSQTLKRFQGFPGQWPV